MVFSYPLGHFAYLVIPFKSTNAVFQALIYDVLCDMLNIFVFVSLDDTQICFLALYKNMSSMLGCCCNF